MQWPLRRAAVSFGLAILLSACGQAPRSQGMTPLDAESDPYLWLEDVSGARALAWVRERNAASQAVLEARPEYAAIRQQALEVLDSKDRIPAIRRVGAHVYNLWQDEANRRGLWRRTTLDEYAKPQPAWETVIDLDALGKAEGENWVWGGANCLGPAYTRCLVALSRGGADAKVVREFDLSTKRFVPAAQGGFELPEAKSEFDWADADTLYVGSDFGPGSMTDSGYPRVIKRWKRGTPLAQATTVFEGTAKDVAVDVRMDRSPGFERTLLVVAPDFFSEKVSLLQADGRVLPIDKPADAQVFFEREWLLLRLRSDWAIEGRTYKAGTLLAAKADAYLKGERRFHSLFEPTATRSLGGWTATRSRLLVEVMDNVKARVEELRWDGSAWQRREVALPGNAGTVDVASLRDELVPNDPLAERYLLSYTDFLTPNTLWLGTAGSDERRLLKTLPALFDADGMRAEQRFAVSKDGTRIPYFVVWPKGAKADASAAPGAASLGYPTLLYGYGGFEVSMQPGYSALRGRAWLARGGVFVLANIRGGGEFGPAWHQAAMKANKQKSYDDFIAVAEDLIATRITTPAHLGIMGGSNGGLLVGATFVQRPDLFKAVVCQVPLLDMRRYHKLLAGASWMAEYGDPEQPAEWDWISRYSPYQNVQRGVRYPEVLLTTSTRDDRVHPAHARKMAARLQSFGAPVLYYENIEGGHGGAADNEQRARLMALEYAYLWRQLAR